MKKLGILKVEEKLKILEKIRKLRDKGFSYTQIREELLKEGIVISKSTIRRWDKEITRPAGSSDINISPSPHLSYFLGALLGDGNIRRKKNYKYEIRLRVKDKDFAEYFAYSLSKILNKSVKVGKERDLTRSGERFSVVVSNKRLWEFLYYNSLSNLIKIAEKFPQDFLRGLFDAEGSASRSSVGFYNTNKEIINSVVRLLKRLGIKTKVKVWIHKGEKVRIRNKIYKSNHDILCVLITKKNDIIKFSRLVGFNISRKRKKLPGGRSVKFFIDSGGSPEASISSASCGFEPPTSGL
ncbi:MAG: hypothetical protein J7L39_04370 [Candidatus Aenigmarchaeota archaeon]|nr:hypothetical protein [Candidatus Aenigmarchaeota archaeon]